MNYDLLLKRDIVLLLGKERFLKDEVISALEDRLITTDFARDFNYSVFSGSDTKLDIVLDCANTLPMMSERKLIVVRDFDEVEDCEKIIERYPEPTGSTLLVLVSGDGEYFRVLNKGFQKKFESHYGPKAEVKVLYELRDHELKDWLKNVFVKNGKTVTSEALSAILSIAGDTMTDLRNEAIKLCSYVGDRKEVTATDVKQILSSDMEVSTEKIRTAVVMKDMAGCLRHFYNFQARFRDKKEYLFLLSDLSKYFRKLAKASYLMNAKSHSRMDIERIKEFNLNYFEAKEIFFKALANFNLEELHSAISRFYPMDRILKSERDKIMILYFERLLIALCRQRTVRVPPRRTGS